MSSVAVLGSLSPFFCDCFVCFALKHLGSERGVYFEMDFLEEINMLGEEIKQLVPKILLKIRQKSSKFDRVLDDKDKKFENYFLNTAKNR